MRTIRLYAIIVLILLFIIGYCSVLWHNQTYSSVQRFFKLYAADNIISASKDISSSITKIRIYIFFGTQSEIMKLSPLILEFRKSSTFLVTTVFTGQHVDIIDKYLRLFNISVDVRFPKILERKHSISILVGKIILQADLLNSSGKDIWIIQGDTSSALAIATVAFHKQVRIAHVEADRRTFNMYLPYPEEFNRKTISSISTYNFVTTSASAKHLIDEGISICRIFVTGNTIVDATKYIEENQLIKKPTCLKSQKFDNLVLIIMHRRENSKVSNSLYKSISLAKCNSCAFVTLIDSNQFAGTPVENVFSIDRRFLCDSPLSFGELQWVLKNVKLVLTDSEDIQDEVKWYNKQTIILRNNTERKESIESGLTHIAGEKELPKKIDELLAAMKFRNMEEKRLPLDNEPAAKQITNILKTTNLSLNEYVINPVLSNVSLVINQSWVLDSQNKSQEKMIDKITMFLSNKRLISVCVILQVYKRKSLSRQLESIVRQSLLPKTIVIVQNGYYVDVSTLIEKYRQQYKEIEIQHIASSKNLRFHGRFHIAFLQKEDYVSIWDDDVYAKRQWLEYSVEYSKAHNFSIVGAYCRVFHKIDLEHNKVIQENHFEQCDFVGHIWTLPRQYLYFYLALEPLTHYMDEDVQLSFALQKQGILSFKPPMTGERFAGVMHTFGGDKLASWKTNKAPRILLFCSLLFKNFQFIKCENCDGKAVLKRCIQLNKGIAKFAEESVSNKDRLENVHAWSK